MKNINIFFFIAFSLFFSPFSISQELLKITSPPDLLYEDISNQYTNVDLSELRSNILFYEINHHLLDKIINNNVNFVSFTVPFFNNNSFNIEMELSINHNKTIEVTRHTNNGMLIEDYNSDLKIFQIKNNSYNIHGVFILSINGIKGVFNYNNNTYQIDTFKQSNLNSNELYFICNVNQSLIPFEFICKNDLLNSSSEYSNDSEHRLINTFGCLDIAIEIDYFTFQTFNNYQDAVDWALEIISVADVIYSDEIGVSIQSNTAQIWETEDPYAMFVDDPQNMLFSLRDYWMSDENLSLIDRHLVHLFSKRNNTGTGGIAFLNGVGSSWNGYGFSSNLTDEATYVDLPVPYFFWNIYCLVHELGHNFGAKHTQWCGWPEGPIDNCTNIEEISQGECADFINNPTPQIGTIMSYCHTWSFASGGGIIMKFHDYVKELVIGYMGLQNLYDCNIDVLFGCTDPSACNYDIEADEDDQSCVYADFNYDCLGNCINDINNNNICDEDEILSFYETDDSSPSIIFPNPAYNFINIKSDNLMFDIKLYNSKGQLVLYEKMMNNNSYLDVSDVPSGIYSAYLINNSNIDKQNIIIQ
ncbi:MAG: hypothetical protein CMP49_01345 [Flavobacteriales bacterium]|nr:hypothetical protein [Flavobacteriales bacterium]|tara:strand:- start:6251 stop:8008 length:1758 start_codon:yes stop_codon:yes gene_type:complete